MKKTHTHKKKAEQKKKKKNLKAIMFKLIAYLDIFQNITCVKFTTIIR